MLIPIYSTDPYVLDRAPRFDQIQSDSRDTDSRNVDLNSRPLDHIEFVAMNQQIASPDIAIPSVECGPGTVKSIDLNENVANTWRSLSKSRTWRRHDPGPSAYHLLSTPSSTTD